MHKCFLLVGCEIKKVWRLLLKSTSYTGKKVCNKIYIFLKSRHVDSLAFTIDHLPVWVLAYIWLTFWF